MKVLLVRPRFPSSEPRLYPPFSLITIAPYFDAEVMICDLQDKQYLHTFLKWNPDVVGFSAFSNQLKEVNRLIEIVKRECEAWIVVGGSGVTVAPEKALRILEHADLLVSGDGEQYARGFTNQLMNSTKIQRSPFFNWRDHKVPAWNLINYQRYLQFPGFAVETSRGCPFNCVFCSAHLICGRKWRSRNPEDVVDEISFLVEQYGCRLFYFPDDNATVDPKRWVNLMQQIIDADLMIKLHAPEGLQAHHLTLDVLKLMKKAGFQHITIGAESGVQRVLDRVIDKGGLKVGQIESVVRDCRSIGLDVNCFFVIGIPGETLAEAEETVEFAEKMRDLGAYSCMVRNAIPVPGTRMFWEAVEHEYLTIKPEELYDYDFIHSGKHLLETPDWTPQQIELLVQESSRQDAKHILHHKKGHMLRKGVVRLFRNPRAAIYRLGQIIMESKK